MNDPELSKKFRPLGYHCRVRDVIRSFDVITERSLQFRNRLVDGETYHGFGAHARSDHILWFAKSHSASNCAAGITNAINDAVGTVLTPTDSQRLADST